MPTTQTCQPHLHWPDSRRANHTYIGLTTDMPTTPTPARQQTCQPHRHANHTYTAQTTDMPTTQTCQPHLHRPDRRHANHTYTGQAEDMPTTPTPARQKTCQPLGSRRTVISCLDPWTRHSGVSHLRMDSRRLTPIHSSRSSPLSPNTLATY